MVFKTGRNVILPGDIIAIITKIEPNGLWVNYEKNEVFIPLNEVQNLEVYQ